MIANTLGKALVILCTGVMIAGAAGAVWNLTGVGIAATIAGLAILAGFTAGVGYSALEVAGEMIRDVRGDDQGP